MPMLGVLSESRARANEAPGVLCLEEGGRSLSRRGEQVSHETGV